MKYFLLLFSFVSINAFSQIDFYNSDTAHSGIDKYLLGLDHTTDPPIPFRYSTNNITRVFNVLDYGATPNDLIDDQAAIQNAINACDADGGGTVYFPAGIYILGGALNTDRNNCQLYIPERSFNDAKRQSIVLKGEVPITTYHNVPHYLIGVQSTSGTILKSTITGTGRIPSVISGKASVEYFAGHPLIYRNIIIENIALVVPAGIASGGPTMTGINGEYFSVGKVINCSVNIDVVINASVEPIHDCAGIILALTWDDSANEIYRTSVNGFKYGIICQEHISIDYCTINNNMFGVVVLNNSYPVIGRLNEIVWNAYGLVFPNFTVMGVYEPDVALPHAYVDFIDIDFEYQHVHSKWYDAQHYIYDPANYGFGFVKYRSGTLPELSIVNGANNLDIVEYNAHRPGLQKKHTTSQRTNHSQTTGIMYYNTTDNKMEYYNGSIWVQF